MNIILTQDPKFLLRFAVPEDATLVVSFMKKLGAYQKMADKKGEAVFGIYDGQTAGFVYFCQTSSAFTGQTGLYIDGFLVDDAMR